jgi:hypothetical protein
VYIALPNLVDINKSSKINGGNSIEMLITQYYTVIQACYSPLHDTPNFSTDTPLNASIHKAVPPDRSNP